MITSKTKTASVKPMITFQVERSQKSSTTTNHSDPEHPLVGIDAGAAWPERGFQCISPRRREATHCLCEFATH
jgi:hypothetical protein